MDALQYSCCVAILVHALSLVDSLLASAMTQKAHTLFDVSYNSLRIAVPFMVGGWQYVWRMAEECQQLNDQL